MTKFCTGCGKKMREKDYKKFSSVDGKKRVYKTTYRCPKFKIWHIPFTKHDWTATYWRNWYGKG